MPDVASEKEHSTSNTASPKSSTKPIKNGLQCQITCLDGTVFSVVVEKDSKGGDLLDKVFEHLNLVEREYFGLQHVKGNKTEKYWLDPTKSTKKQLKNATPNFDFGVKFFEPSPRDIKTDYTRYLMCLHLREDIATGKLTSSFIAQANLGAYFVQAELGDYDPREHKDDYLDGFVFAPNQTPELIEKIMSMHKSIRGITPEEADLRYMETARQLILYGVDCHPAMDAELEYVCLGISYAGILVYKDNTTINTFRWPTIEDVAYKGRSFTVTCRPGEFGDLVTTLVYKLENEKAAKNCWKSCVEYHTFYRLKSPDPRPSKGERMMKLGSKFRYSDRTLYQLRKERPSDDKPGQQPPEKFQRVPSRHRSGRGQPTEHVLHVVDKEEDPTRKRPLDNEEEEQPAPVSPAGKVYRPNETRYRDVKKAPLMEEESMATMTPEEREMYREKMAKQIQKTTTTTTTTVLVIKNDGDDEGTQLEQSPIAKELKEEALVSKGVEVEGGRHAPKITELDDEEEERRKKKEIEEEEITKQQQERFEHERREWERIERERIERERLEGDRTHIVGGYVAGERPRRTQDLQQSEEDTVDVSYSTAVAGAMATPVRKDNDEEEEEDLEFMAFTAATPSTEEVKTAKRKTMDFDEEYDKGEVRRLEDDFNKAGVTTSKTVTTTTYVVHGDDYQGRPESPTLLEEGASPYHYQGNSDSLPSRRPKPPVAPKRFSSGDRLDDKKDDGYSKLITREELVRSYSPAGTLDDEQQIERDTKPEIRTSLKEDLDLDHEQGERGFVLESIRKNEQIIDDISTQAEVDKLSPQSDLDQYQPPPRPPPPVSEVSTKTILLKADSSSPTLVRNYNVPEVQTVIFKVENNQLQPIDADSSNADDFPPPPPEVEETDNGVVVTRTVTIEGSPQPQASRTEIVKTTTMPAEIITKTITIQGDGKPLTAQELSEIMALQSGPAGNFSPTETSTKTFTTTQQVRRVQKIDKVVTEKKIISADGTTEICTGDPDTDAAIAKALEEARSAGADSTVTEVVITKSDDFDSEV